MARPARISLVLSLLLSLPAARAVRAEPGAVPWGAPVELVRQPAEELIPQRLPTPDFEPEEVFPALPPDPNHLEEEPLPPLDEELWLHGGSYLYQCEGDLFNLPHDCEDHHVKRLRLPEDYLAPQPFTLFQEFLGADPIRDWPRLYWFGQDGFQWEPRLVAYGRLDMLAFYLDEGGTDQAGIGAQIQVDVDLRLTGTERFHVQFRPIGEGNSGGSYYQLTRPQGYVDNSTVAPQRFWFEGEFFSIFQGLIPTEFIPLDYHVVVGRFPFLLQNALLLNDEIVGFVVNKNTIFRPNLSNLNVQVFYAFDSVEDSFHFDSDLYGTNISADYRRWLFELTYAHVDVTRDSSRDSDYAALGATQFFGPLSLAGRAMFKWGDEGGRGAGELFVIESNWTRVFEGSFAHRVDIEYGVFYLDAFRATKGWNPISGGNFDRLRSSFAVSPLVSIARGTTDDTEGVAFGVQLFRHHEDQSITPEIAYEAPQGTGVVGIGLRFQQKTGKRSFFEVRGVGNWSSDRRLQRSGAFLSETILF